MKQASALTVSREDLIVAGRDDEFRGMVHDLLAFAARLEGVRACFGEIVGLRGVQYSILITVRHLQAGAGAGVSAVAKHLALSGPFVTSEINRLVKLRLVEKTPHPDDKRRVLITLTKQGEEALDALAPVQQEVNDVLFQPVAEAGFARFRQLANELRESADRALLLAEYLSSTTIDRTPQTADPRAER